VRRRLKLRLPIEAEREALDLARGNGAFERRVKAPLMPGRRAGSAFQLVFAQDPEWLEDSG
jgi:hypothetical protein